MSPTDEGTSADGGSPADRDGEADPPAVVPGGRVVAIDGPSAAGKSTIARNLADELDLPHVDTGAMYRAATLAALRRGVDVDDAQACARVAREARIERRDGRTLLDGEDVEEEIRGPEVTGAVSRFSAHGPVRDAMIPVQRAAVVERGGVVEGRDIGTVVLPDADLKIYLTASLEERARRRAAEQGSDDLDAAARELEERDSADAGRVISPLARAEDAWEVDTTGLDPAESVDAISQLARSLWGTPPPGEGGETDDAAEVGSGAPDGERAPPVVRDAPDDGPVPIDEVVPDEPVAPYHVDESEHPAIRVRRALPRVAIVGRPNVGKSTLVNRILGRREAIVEERPGVTRDRTEHVATWLGRPFVVVDTGGWEHSAEGMTARIVEQAERAVATADLVVFVVDATVGAMENDELYARSLRKAERPVLLAANKVDSPKQEPDVHDLYVLGLGDPHPISAAHGRGIGDLLDAVLDALPEVEEQPDADEVPRVAVIGRPNVGKSSLFNRLLGEERSIVHPVPHTTRDAVDSIVELDGEPWIFVDTAGLRRRYRHGEETELYSVDRTRRALGSADLALFVIDASEPLGEQDQRLAAMVRDAGCGLILVLNKWDLVDEQRRYDLEREVDRLLRFTTWAPRVNVSAETGRGVGRIVPWLQQVHEAYRTRIPTGELNTWLREAVERQPPPTLKGRRPLRLKYATQVRTGPPTFLVFTNGPLDPAYGRYLERGLRERYGFVGSPIVLRDRSGDR